MLYETHGLRHDTDHLFALLLREEKWVNTPCVVIHGEEIRIARAAEVLLCFPDDSQVICGWPGETRQDMFEFKVGQFRSAVAGRSPVAKAEPVGIPDPEGGL